MPATDGLKLGTFGPPLRRWDASKLINLILQSVTDGELPSPIPDGWLFRYAGDNRAYYVFGVDNPQLLAFSGEEQPPSLHGNPKHSYAYADAMFLHGAYFVDTDLTVSNVVTTIASATITIAIGRREYLMPMAGFNFRPSATNTADRILSAWIDVDGTQRSAKFPLTLKLAEVKHPFTLNLAMAGALDLGYWQGEKTGSLTLSVKGQMDSENGIVSDRFLTALRFSKVP